MIEVRGLEKHFGKTKALDGVDLDVEQGTILGLLGPNGAGKTTLVRILATLLVPDAGSAKIAGHNVAEEPTVIRSLMGLAGQYAAVDEHLTGRESLELVGRLYHLSRSEAKKRASEVLERFRLEDAADRPAKTYSGGMRRRLDLGASLVGRPPVLLLDEPTTGLDPRTRMELWSLINDLVAEGTTILLTTQYLEEADQLAKKIVVIDRGKAIADGTSDELKNQLGGDVLELKVDHESFIKDAAAILEKVSGAEPLFDEAQLKFSIPAPGGASTLIEVVRLLDERKIKVEDVGIRRPSLDDVFLALTGHVAEDHSPAIDEAGKGSGNRNRSRRSKSGFDESGERG